MHLSLGAAKVAMKTTITLVIESSEYHLLALDSSDSLYFRYLFQNYLFLDTIAFIRVKVIVY